MQARTVDRATKHCLRKRNLHCWGYRGEPFQRPKDQGHTVDRLVMFQYDLGNIDVRTRAAPIATIVKFSIVRAIFSREENHNPLFMNNQKIPLRP